MECLSDEAFARLLDAGQSPPPDFDAHVVSCDRCRALWVRMIREHRERTVAGSVPDEVEPDAAVPDIPGRYMVIDLIGRGGMGEVFRAYDTRVHREVALKRVRTSVYDGRARARFEREARAMGKLQHPNVVALHGVEELEHGDLVLVMEFVDGPSLLEWLAEDRDVEEVLQRFIEAGSGLAAAHAQGLLHRDFKPANALISPHGAKVTDFGLAKVVGDGSAGFSAGPALGDAEVSQVGVGVGTPAYMAPECFVGEASAASDQFAFCVALWEALVGERPGGEQPGRLGLDEPPPWPARAGPRWVGRALRRGLCRDPAQRWPSMDALLRRLSPRRRVASVFGLAAAGLGAAAVTAALMGTDPDPCASTPSSVQEAWSPARRAAVAGRMRRRAGVDPDRVDAALGAYVQRWSASAAAVCRLERREHVEPAQHLRARQCIDGVELEAQALLGELEEANGTLAEQALDLIADLPPPEVCHDIDTLDRQPPRIADPATRQAVRGVRARIRHAVLRRDGGDAAGCLEALLALEEDVGAIAEPSLGAAFHSATAGCSLAHGEHARAAEAGLSAYGRALRGGDDLLAARAATQLAMAWVDDDLQRALAWADIARSTFERHGFRHPGRAAEVYSAAATVHASRGEPEAALGALRAGMQVLEGLDGARIPLLTLRSRELAVLANRYEAAVPEASAVAREIAEVYGPLHAETLLATNLLGTTLAIDGQLDASIDALREALSIVEAWDGTPRRRAYQEYLLASAMLEGGRLDEARRIATRGLKRVGEERGWITTALLRNLALTELVAGDPATAEAWLERLRDPPPADAVAEADLRLLEAQIQLQRGELEAAEASLREAQVRLDAADNEGRTLARPRLRFEVLLALEECGATRDADRVAWDALARSDEAVPMVRAYVSTLRSALGYKRPAGVARMATRLETLALRLGEPQAAAAYAEVAATARE